MFWQNFDHLFWQNCHKNTKLFFRHKSVLKLKNWRKQNQPGIKFYNIECVEFMFGTFLTEIPQNLDFPHFQLFQIFALLHIQPHNRIAKDLLRQSPLRQPVVLLFLLHPCVLHSIVCFIKAASLTNNFLLSSDFYEIASEASLIFSLKQGHATHKRQGRLGMWVMSLLERKIN